MTLFLSKILRCQILCLPLQRNYKSESADKGTDK